MYPDLSWGLAAVAAILTAAAFFVGRWMSGERARKLESELTVARGELEQARLEVESLRRKLSAAQDEYDAYRMNVLEHFSGTSDLLRDLTVQYRSVYQHLTKGAATLCPEGFVGLTEGLPKPALAGPPPELEIAADEEVPELNPPDEEAHRTVAAARS